MSCVAERHFYVLSYAHAVPVLITPHGRVARASRVAISHLKVPNALERAPHAPVAAPDVATAHPVALDRPADLIPCAWGLIPLDARIAEIGKSNDPNPPLTERVACRRIVATSRSLTLFAQPPPAGVGTTGESASAARRGEGAELPRPPLGPSPRFPGLMVMLRGVSCGALPSLSFRLPKSPRGQI